MEQIVHIHKYSLNRSSDSGIDFYGIYSTGKMPELNLSLDFYWLGYQRKQSVWSEISGRENRQTVGGRFGGRFSGNKGQFDLEAALQLGSVADADVTASMLAGRIEYAFDGRSITPLVYSGIDYGSGDADPADNKIGTFNQLFPLGHAYLGYLDMVGRQNIVDWNAGISISLPYPLNFAFDLHNFWRARNSDALYNPSGGIVRAGNLGSSKRVGSEIDLTLKSSINRHLLVAGGYSHFFPGTFIKESGSANGIHFAHLTIQTTF